MQVDPQGYEDLLARAADTHAPLRVGTPRRVELSAGERLEAGINSSCCSAYYLIDVPTQQMMTIGPVTAEKIVAHCLIVLLNDGFCRQGRYAPRLALPPTNHWTRSTSIAYELTMRRLPPLAAVRVFEAAARHENFTAAAAELGMTQAAVSYQIKLLEERLNAPLFRREKRRVVLTEAGRRAAPQVTRAFDTIDSAFGAIRAEDEAVLTVSTSNTFANTWLVWRLGSFQMNHPEMAVRLLTSDAITDFASDDVDVAIRAGLGGWEEVVEENMVPIDFTPMCSPGFLERYGPFCLSDLLTVPQISPHDPWWSFWLREAGVDVPEGPPRPGVRLDSQAHEGHAAMAGQGMAMLTPFFWRNDLADGRLVRPFAQVSTRGYAYWLVYPKARRKVTKIRRFREWIFSELARDLPSPV